MSDDPEYFESDPFLQQGLRCLPVPSVSEDFDARIHAALRKPIPWWQSLWASVRPVLAATTCSLVVTLALLQGLGGSPSTVPPSTVAVKPDALSSEHGRMYMEMLDKGMERIDLPDISRRVFMILWEPIAVKSHIEAPLSPPSTTSDSHS